MDGNGPGQSQGHLSECALHFGFDCVGGFIDGVSTVFPHLRGDVDKFPGGGDTHPHKVVGERYHLANQTVVVAVLRGVIFYEHYLCADFEGKLGGSGVKHLAEGAFDCGFKSVRFGGERAHTVVVVAVGRCVVGGQTDVSTSAFRDECRVQTGVERDAVGLREAVVAHVVEQLHE